jgi:hypothetical protein
MNKDTATRVKVYGGLFVAILLTLAIVGIRSLGMTGRQAAEYLDGCLCDIYRTAKVAQQNQEHGRSVLKQVVVIQLKARAVRRFHQKVTGRLRWTERALKHEHLPESILKRHSLFVSEFEANVESLTARTTSLTHDYWGSFLSSGRQGQFMQELDALVDFLGRKEPPQLDIPIDPHKLTHRVMRGEPLDCAEYRQGQEHRVGHTIGTPLPADLSEAVGTESSSEIRALARELKRSPVGIFDYVKNNFDYEPYYGSLKGADLTLEEKAGNDFDLASLLICLLRASGIPSRYVHGEVVVPIRDLKSWLGGVGSASTAAEILSASGIPAVLLTQASDTIAVQIEHCWVDAFLGRAQSGVGASDGGHWLALDPSFKRYVYERHMDVSDDVVFDEEAYLNYLAARDGIRRFLPKLSHSSAPIGVIPSPSDFYLNAVKDFLRAHYPDSSASSVEGVRTVAVEHSDVLQDSLPYEFRRIISTFSEVPEGLRHRLLFEIPGAEGGHALTCEVSTPQIAGKPVFLYYLPAEEADRKAVGDGGMAYGWDAHLVDVRPHLKIGGKDAAVGSAVRLGEDQVAEIAFLFPGRGEIDRVQVETAAGGVYCLAFDLQRTSEQLAKPFVDDMATLLRDETWYANDLDREADLERYLQGQGMWYFLTLDERDESFQKMLHVASCREPSLAVLGTDFRITYLFGVPFGVIPSGSSMDTYRIVNKPFPLFGEKNRQKMYNVISGYESSFLMDEVYEHWRKRQGFCALEVLQLAKQRRIPVYTVSNDNIHRIAPRLRLSAEALKKIENLVEAGAVVRVPQRELVVGNWRGIGYIVMDPGTGDATYKLRQESEASALPPGSIRLILEYVSVLISAVVATVATLRLRRRRREARERERRRSGGPPLRSSGE